MTKYINNIINSHINYLSTNEKKSYYQTDQANNIHDKPILVSKINGKNERTDWSIMFIPHHVQRQLSETTT